MKLIVSKYLTGLFVVFLLTTLTACIDSGSDSSASNNSTDTNEQQITAESVEAIPIRAAGIKGPLAFADGKIYAFDSSFPEFYDSNSPISSAIGNQFADIEGLSVPRDIQPPYVLTVGGDHAIDLNTGRSPVISTLVTVITENMLAGSQTVYATPLTTLAFRMATQKNNAPRDAKRFVQRLKRAASEISDILAIDQGHVIDIFSSPLLINDATDTRAKQEQAVYHRATLEAFAAKVHRLALRNKLSAETIIDRVALDIESDGVIDNAANGEVIGGLDPATLMQDPAKLSIPNTTHKIEDTITLMEEERTAMGTDRGPDLLVDTIEFDTPATSNINSGPTSPDPVAGTDPAPAIPTAPVVPTAPEVMPATFPIALQGTASKQATVIMNVNKPSDSVDAVMTLTVLDADFRDEGELIINGNAPVALFGASGTGQNDRVPDRIPVVSASANRWEEPNVPTNTIDDDLGTRWSCENDGEPDCYIVFDLGSVQSVTRVEIASFQGDERMALFGLEASLNGTDWTQVWPNGTSSSGTTLQPEPFSVGMQAQYLRHTGQGNTANNWASVNEFHVYGKPVSPPLADVTISTPAAYWKDGDNTLLFKHTSTAGFVIQSATVSFQAASIPVYEPILTVSTDTINFGNLDVGSISDIVGVVLTNVGNAPFNISSIDLSGSFIETNDCDNYLPAGASCSIDVAFVPTAVGEVTGSLAIAGDSVDAPYRLSLAGSSTIHPSTPATSMERIQKYSANPWYWEFKGQPILLLGGSIHSNLFHVNNLASHLDEIKAAGGNYLRVTMSQRKKWNIDTAGMELPYAISGGKFDLNQWNSNYWNKFADMLKWANDRDMIVQLELFDRWDYVSGSWQDNPFRPGNNVNYTTAQSGLADVVNRPSSSSGWINLPFFATVPAMDNNTLLLDYQEEFVREVLSYTLQYSNVLYTISNETESHKEWGKYWSSFVKSEATAAGVSVETSQMWDKWDIADARHHLSYDNPQTYSFLDLSQNSQNSNETHWNGLQYARNAVSSEPRPMNHVKTYGSDQSSKTEENAIEVFWRNLIGGAASVRFHRPNGGLGISQQAKNVIASARKLETKVKLWEVTPQQSLLSNRGTDEAYLAAEEGEQYALFFTNGGSVRLNLSSYSGIDFQMDWINVNKGQWGSSSEISGGGTETIAAPGSGPWVVAIVKK